MPRSYQLLTTEQGVEYLSKRGIQTNEWKSKDLLPHRGVYVYPLANGEIVTLEAGLCDGRPAFIFNNQESFQKFVTADFFPLLEKDMSWLEINTKHVKNFLVDRAFYAVPLSDVIRSQAPFETLKDLEAAYYKVQNYIHRREISTIEITNISYCFALAVAEFLIKKEKFLFAFDKQYNGYNPSYYIMILTEENRKRDIFSSCSRALQAKTKASFRTFYWYATNIAPNAIIK